MKIDWWVRQMCVISGLFTGKKTIASVREMVNSKWANSLICWRWSSNFNDSVKHCFDSPPTTDLRDLASQLRKKGLCDTNWSTLCPNRNTYCEISNATEITTTILDQKIPHHAVPEKKTDAAKPYLRSLLPQPLDFNSEFIQCAIDPDLLAFAGTYLGTRPYLREIELILNEPSGTVARESQLWHRDGDDKVNLKIFSYLTNVDVDNGPFWYVDGSHRYGDNWSVGQGSWNDRTRISDEAMQQAISRRTWTKKIGAPGTVFVVDTSGYHKGGFVETQHRIAFIIHYTSRKPVYPRRFQIKNYNPNNLSRLQRAALEPVECAMST
tara:strand:+ start:375 stop:1346 length:972 start_codon:yes stop_codon:yes gene_type:complete